MRISEVKVYSFNELSEQAKKKVIETLSDINTDYNWWDAVYDDFATFCGTIGIEVDLKNTHFALSYSQGDGAGFSARIDLPKLLEAIDNQTWKDGYPKENFKFYPVTVNMKRICKLIQSGSIDGNAWIEESNRGTDSKLVNEYSLTIGGKCMNPVRVQEELDNLIEFLEDVTKTLNRWFFNNLRTECDYLSSDEAIIETIEANEYEFTENGKIFRV